MTISGPGLRKSSRSVRERQAAGRRRPVPISRILLAWAFAIVVFAPSVIRTVAAPRVVITILAVATILHESGRTSPQALRFVQTVVVPYVALATITLTAFRAGGSNSFNFQRLLIVTPVCIAMGYLTARNGSVRTWAQAFVGVGVVNGTLAIVEASIGRSLIGRSVAFALNERDGGARALLAADHSLVLGAILAACVPLVYLSKVRWPIVYALVLVAGSWATGSRGPTVIAGLVALTYLVPASEKLLRKYYRALMVGTAAFLVAVGLMSVFVWKPIAAGEIGTSYSTDYRTALYAELPHILAARPLGYGIAGLPPDEWLIDSRLFGVQDVATTIDSEVVLSASNFGVLGVAAFLFALFYCGLLAIRSDAYLGLASSVVSFTGMFLALHAWDSLGPMWYLLIGMSVFVVRNSRRTLDKPSLDGSTRRTPPSTGVE